MLRAILFAAMIALPALAGAQTTAVKVDTAIVSRALAYLNGARTITAKFIQRDMRGNQWAGRLWVDRPGRLRFQYDPPESDVIWSDQNLVKHFDAELETLTHVPRNLTPAWFLLDDPVRITQDVQVLATAETPDRYFITAAQNGVLAEGRVTLAFSKAPETLIGWTVTDGSGAVTHLDLYDLKVGGPIDRKLFQFNPPIPQQ